MAEWLRRSGYAGDNTAAAAADAGKQAADEALDALRHLVAALGAAVASDAGQASTQDAARSRSLPALSKVLKNLWLQTPLGERERELSAPWLQGLLLVTEGSREGIISFFGAGLLMCDALDGFAEGLRRRSGVVDERSLHEEQVDLGAEWAEVLTVTRTCGFDGPSRSHLQSIPADHLCSGLREGLLTTNRLPAMMRRTFDLEGHKLTNIQAAGLGVAMITPGSGMAAMSGLGAMFLYRKVKRHASGAGASAGPASELERLQLKCEAKADNLLQRKLYPIEVTYLSAPSGLGPPKLKVCLYPSEQATLICAIPAGGFSSEGGGVAHLGHGEKVILRPRGSDTFMLRAFRPALLDVALHDPVQVRRGDRVVVMPAANGEVKCHITHVEQDAGCTTTPSRNEDG